MRARREEDSSKNSNSKLSKDFKAWVEDVNNEVLLTHKTLLHTLHEEQPSYLLFCQAVLICLQHPSIKDLPPSISCSPS